MLRKLWEKYTNPNTAMLMAAARGNHKAVRMYLESGVDPNYMMDMDRARIRRGSTALLEAVSESTRLVSSWARVVEVLLEFGAKPDFPPASDGVITPLVIASRKGDEQIVRMLLAAGADPNARHRGTGMTPIMPAAGAGHLAVVKLLIDAGADPEARDNEGHGAVSEATKNGFTKVVNLVISASGR